MNPALQLDVFEGLSKWGAVRLRPDHLENVIYVELLPQHTEEWKPLYMFTIIGGRVAMRVLAEKNDRVLVYDAATHTFSDLNPRLKGE